MVSRTRVERLEADAARQGLTPFARLQRALADRIATLTDAELHAEIEGEFAKLPPDMRELAEHITVAELDTQIQAELAQLTPAERDEFLRDFAQEHGLPWGSDPQKDTP